MGESYLIEEDILGNSYRSNKTVLRLVVDVRTCSTTVHPPPSACLWIHGRLRFSYVLRVDVFTPSSIVRARQDPRIQYIIPDHREVRLWSCVMQVTRRSPEKRVHDSVNCDMDLHLKYNMKYAQ